MIFKKSVTETELNNILIDSFHCKALLYTYMSSVQSYFVIKNQKQIMALIYFII